MTRRQVPPCQTPTPPHSLTRARLYPSGWECDRHSPWARRGLPEDYRAAQAATNHRKDTT